MIATVFVLVHRTDTLVYCFALLVVYPETVIHRDPGDITTKDPERQSRNQSRDDLAQRRKDAKERNIFRTWRLGERKSESEKICASRADLQS